MAYNFKNALVNLNEEIRKFGGGGGQIPALKLAVSQLQVSMTAVKSSVANVSAEVDAIKTTLQSLTTFASDATKTGEKWVDGRDIYHGYYDLGSTITFGSDWTNTNINNSDIDIVFQAAAINETGVYRGNIQIDPNTGSYVRCQISGGGTATRYIYLKFVKTAPTRKGGKK